MNIGVDARLLERKITGIGRVLINFLNEVPLYDQENQYYLFSYEPIEFENTFYTIIPTVKSMIPQKLFAPIWNNLILPYYLKKHKIEVLFSVNQILPLFKINGCKYVSIVHDVIYKADPKFLPYVYRKYLQFFAYFSIKISDAIITVSEYSKSDILRNYDVSSEKIKVIYPSVNNDFKLLELSNAEITEIKSNYNLKENVVLYVGMIENRKNILGILKIAGIINKKRSNIDFVLVGKKGYGSKKILKQINKSLNVKHLSNIDDTTLKKLYNIADVFLFPSFYEGFGYPPLEAMQCGLPVITSNYTSLKEIIDFGGIMHNSDDFKSMSVDILRLLEDKNFHLEMRNKGIERAKKFNEKVPAQELVKVFNSFKNNLEQT